MRVVNMDWLLHNFIADMYGPQFLVFYGGIIVVTLAACWWSINRRDPSSSLPPLQVPVEPDPYEIAYLRGGENEVMGSAIFNLIQRGYLQVGSQHVKDEPRKFWQEAKLSKPIEHAPDHPDPRHLSALGRSIFEWFATPRTAQEIFQSELAAKIQTHCAAYKQRLEHERLLMPSEWKKTTESITIFCALIIVGLGAYKLIIALEKGRYNVGFLIMMGVVAMVILLRIVGKPLHLSSRGKAYLERLQKAFEKLKTQSSKVTDAADQSLLLLVGLFGVGALAGTAYDSYQRIFHQETTRGYSSAWGSSSCSSCSSSGGSSCGSCGGGSCGGGCGGCGGA
jgi:uncharacterized protein (TIGR04222 family)